MAIGTSEKKQSIKKQLDVIQCSSKIGQTFDTLTFCGHGMYGTD